MTPTCHATSDAKAQVKRVRDASLGAKLIKLADKLDNVTDVCDPRCAKDLVEAQEYCKFAADVVDQCRYVFSDTFQLDFTARTPLHEACMKGGRVLLDQWDTLLNTGVIVRGDTRAPLLAESSPTNA